MVCEFGIGVQDTPFCRRIRIFDRLPESVPNRYYEKKPLRVLTFCETHYFPDVALFRVLMAQGALLRIPPFITELRYTEN
jgi:hypothetical protein